MRHGHASLGLQAWPGVEARVRRLGQGPGLGLDREKLYFWTCWYRYLPSTHELSELKERSLQLQQQEQ